MDDGWSTTLSSHKNNINEIWRRRHRTHFLEVVDGHVGITIRSLIKIIVKSIFLFFLLLQKITNSMNGCSKNRI